MERLKRTIKKLLYPGAAVVMICVPVAAALLVYTFMYAGEESPITYVSYVFSAYALVIACVNVAPLIRRGKARAESYPIVQRWRAEPAFRINVTLHASLVINMLYSALNAVYGFVYRSAWFGTLAVYYVFLAMLRFLLVRYAHSHGFGTNMRGEWTRYRVCGALLTAMTIALAGVVVLVLHNEGGFSYAGNMIFVMALYAFYATINGVINLVKYRKYKSPAMSAARVVSLASALVSMFSLEIAMLAQFGGEGDEQFRPAMTLATGAAVCLIVIGLGSHMIVRASRALGGEERSLENGHK